MKDLIGIAVLVASLYGGTSVARWIYREVQIAALEKAAQGLPPLTPFARALTSHPAKTNQQKGGSESQ